MAQDVKLYVPLDEVKKIAGSSWQDEMGNLIAQKLIKRYSHMLEVVVGKDKLYALKARFEFDNVANIPINPKKKQSGDDY